MMECININVDQHISSQIPVDNKKEFHHISIIIISFSKNLQILEQRQMPERKGSQAPDVRVTQIPVDEMEEKERRKSNWIKWNR